MYRRLPLVALYAILLLLSGAPRADAQEKPLQRIAFGCCSHQSWPQPIWKAIVAVQPELFLYMGDTVYCDTEDMDELRAAYAVFAAFPGWQKLRKTCPVLATWDDHDYGENDGGADYPKKDESQQIFLDFFDIPKDSPRRKQKGVYNAAVFGPPDKRVQVIMLDTRYFRGTLKKREEYVRGQGPCLPNVDPKATVLGAAQWKWLERQLKIPAKVRLLISSIQVISEDHGFEKWMNFPHERERLYRVIRETKATGVILLSGDRHFGELSMMDAGIGYPLYDLTSSGLNQGYDGWRKPEANRRRLALMNQGDNFGLITIDWERPDPLIGLQVRDTDGDITIQEKVPLSWLRPGTIWGPTGGQARLASGEILVPEVVEKYRSKKCTVEMEVRSTGDSETFYFLNSAPDSKTAENFTVVIPRKLEEAFKKAGIEDVTDHYEGKTVRVTAVLSDFRGRPQMMLSSPKQIRVVEKKGAKK